MVKKNQTFTNEHIMKQYNSPFELVNFAIALSRDLIKTRKVHQLNLGEKSLARYILQVIADGKDLNPETFDMNDLQDYIPEDKPKH